MRVLVTGSRHWHNVKQLEDKLRELQRTHGDLVIGHGNSRGGGVDLFVQNACEKMGIPQERYPVLGCKDGRHRAAPLKRNERMVKTFKPDLVLAFRSKGISNGTDYTLEFAKKLGHKTIRIEEEET